MANEQKKAKKMFSVSADDPLFVIFEKHLYDFNYSDRNRFIEGVVEEYIYYLVSQEQLTIPALWRSSLEENLSEEISDMLVRKIYGCLTIDEFKEKKTSEGKIINEKEAAEIRYQKLVS